MDKADADGLSNTSRWIDTEGATAIERAINNAAHLLPAQGPITVFVHHNTLHALEDLPFEHAVLKAQEIFGCRPYLNLQRYQQEMACERILQSDIDACLLDSAGDTADTLVGFLGTRFHLRRAILMHPFQAVVPNELEWVIAESQALTRFAQDVSPNQARQMVNGTKNWVQELLKNCPLPEPTGTEKQSRQLTSKFEVDRTDSRSSSRRFWQLVESTNARFAWKKMHRWNETTWTAFTLHLLWGLCLQGTSLHPTPASREAPVRHRDFLYLATGVDSDQLVHEELIRFCLVMLDQGLSRWQLPGRQLGILLAYSELNTCPTGLPCQRWLRPLGAELERIRNREKTPLDSIQESLQLLGVPAEEFEPFIAKTLLSLRGFAGIIWQMEKRRDRIAHPLPSGSLVEFLALYLLLERLALKFVAAEHLSWNLPLSALRNLEHQQNPSDLTANLRCEAFAVFQLAQGLGWRPELLWNLTDGNWKRLLDEIRCFDENKRLAIYHQAYERRFRQKYLDALQIHCLDIQKRIEQSHDARPVVFDVVTCIDEREESLRRHIEEMAPQSRTWGAAGFFSVAMYYRAAESSQFVPLCPIVIEPQHYVREIVSLEHSKLSLQRSSNRKQIGAVMLGVHTRSRMLLSGALAALLGTVAAIPLVARVLFPRTTGMLRHQLGQLISASPPTVLEIERPKFVTHDFSNRTNESTDASHEMEFRSGGPTDDPTIGFSVEEMSGMVERLLRDIGMTKDWSRLIVILGHGSCTLNNPHESAYDCGACGGGRGGPNARAIAQMANNTRVRSLLGKRGLCIPSTTWFVGGFHNTCSDEVKFFDLSCVPTSHSDDLTNARQLILQACQRNAHERCRRFESADLELSTNAAFRHVRARSEDLSQVRPECGHATNAVCFVGRRQWTRGLFMDRRAFLHSYNPDEDDAESSVLSRILAAVIPVCAGINLEYYFSHVDPEGYGCGTKLPHNIASLVGVMNGAASDLRPGLPWQMVEIHEPIRLMVTVESSPQTMERIMKSNPSIDRMVRGGWVQLSTIRPEIGLIHRYSRGRFEIHVSESGHLPKTPNSSAWYRGRRDHLDFAQLTALLENSYLTEMTPS